MARQPEKEAETTPKVKICGLKTRPGLLAALESGADFIGLVFYGPSPRSLSLQEAKNLLAGLPPHRSAFVALFVEPSNGDIEKVIGHLPVDFIQLHGHETPERVEEIRERYGKPIIKAVRVRTREDVEIAESYEAVADWLLFDAASEDGALPGGSGRSFDWELMAGYAHRKPWMLAGGLTPANVAEAIRHQAPSGVDVSSGVEESPGVKSPEKVKEFIERARRPL